jgi:hypothetical protein
MDAVEDVGARSFVNRRTKKREYFECLVSAAIVPSLRTGVGMCGDRELERFTLRGQSANGSWKKGVPLPAIGPALWAMFRELNSRNFAPVHETLRPFAKLVAPTAAEDTC